MNNVKAQLRCLSYHAFTWSVFAHLASSRLITHKDWFYLPVQRLCDTSVQYLIIQCNTHNNSVLSKFLQLQPGSTSVQNLKGSGEASFFKVSVALHSNLGTTHFHYTKTWYYSGLFVWDYMKSKLLSLDLLKMLYVFWERCFLSG